MPDAPVAAAIASPSSIYPEVAGTARAGATVTVALADPSSSAGGVNAWSTVADAAGDWTVALPGIASGTTSVVVTQTVTAGDTTFTSPASAPLEVITPVPTLEATPDGYVVTGVPHATFRLNSPDIVGALLYAALVGEQQLDATGYWSADASASALIATFPPTLEYTGPGA